MTKTTVPMPERAAPAAKVSKQGQVSAKKAPAKKSTARSRPKPLHQDERGRESRAQEARAELFERVDEDAPYIKPTSLEAPRALQGMKQRWVRVGMKDIDEKNLARKMGEGWRARPASTVPKGFHVPTIKSGGFAGTIMVEGMLLCHIPIKLANKRAAAIREQTNAKTNAVNESLMRVNEGAGGGFHPIKKGERSQLVREVAKTSEPEEVDLT